MHDTCRSSVKAEKETRETGWKGLCWRDSALWLTGAGAGSPRMRRNRRGMSGREDVEPAKEVGKGTECCPLGGLGTSRWSSRCSSWRRPHLFPQVLPYSTSGIKCCLPDPQLYSEMTPVLHPLHQGPSSPFFSIMRESHTVPTVAPVLNTWIWHVLSCSSESFPRLPAPHLRLWDAVQRVRLWVRRPWVPTLSLLWRAVWLDQSPPFPTHSVLPCARSPQLGSMPDPIRPLCLFMPPFVHNSSPSAWATHGVSPGYVQILTVWGLCKVRDHAVQLSYHWPTYFICQAAEAQSNFQCLSLILLSHKPCHLSKCCWEIETMPQPPGFITTSFPQSLQQPPGTMAVIHQLFYCLIRLKISSILVPQGKGVLSFTLPAVSRTASGT